MPEITKSAEQIELERLTRRQALRKLGFGAGLSAFMLLGVDDLARMVGAEMQKRAGDNKVAEQVAKEFQNAGIAFAAGPSGGYCSDCTNACVEDDDHYCVDCDASCSSPSVTFAARRRQPKPPVPQSCIDFKNGNMGNNQCQQCSTDLLALCNSGGSCNCQGCDAGATHYGCANDNYKTFYNHWHDCAKCLPNLPAP